VGAERQRLFGVLETLPTMICLLTEEHHVAFANRAFREKFGPADGRRGHEHCFGSAEPCAFCQSYEVLRTGRPHRGSSTAPAAAGSPLSTSRSGTRTARA
jgi:PAS domain-containing protein